MDTSTVESLVGQLVTVTITYGEGETISAHGRLGGVRKLSVVEDPSAHSMSVYTQTAEEAERFDQAETVAPWVTIQDEAGSIMPAPTGSRGLYGAQARNSSFRLACAQWILRDYSWMVNLTSEAISIEPITAEGLKWIEQNLSTDKRRARLEEKLRAIDPKLADELDDVIWREREDARADEARRSLDY